MANNKSSRNTSRSAHGHHQSSNSLLHYWQEQVRCYEVMCQREPSVSKRLFCDRAGIHYGQYLYWHRKISKLHLAKKPLPTSSLVPVLKKESASGLKSLATLILSNTQALHIHDAGIVIDLIERSIRCN